MKKTIKTRELQLGDVVSLYEGAYSTATVKKITEDLITLFRPYVHASDFPNIGGIMCYIGIEEFTIHRNTDQDFVLFFRKKN